MSIGADIVNTHTGISFAVPADRERLIQRINEAVYSVIKTSSTTTAPRGCVCPPGAEVTCRSLNCGRGGPISATGFR